MENYVFGRNNVIELLQNSNRTVSKIIIADGSQNNSKVNLIIQLAKQNGILFQILPKEKFTKFNSYSHQGVIAYVSPVKFVDLYEFLNIDKNNKKVIILDGIEDPHNVGSIIRSAVCAGFDAVIFPSRRNAVINSTVEKSSAGAVNRLDLIMVNSLAATIDKLKDNNFWIIATDIHSKDNYYDIDYCNMNFAIIMGSENSGVSATLLKKSDFRIKIPMLADFNSLNVANAAAVVIFESVKQTLQNRKDVV